MLDTRLHITLASGIVPDETIRCGRALANVQLTKGHRRQAPRAKCPACRSRMPMDPRRFDVMVRRLATAGDRRALLRAVLIAVSVKTVTGLPRRVAGQD